MKIENAKQKPWKSENKYAMSENDYKSAEKRNIFLRVRRIIFE